MKMMAVRSLQTLIKARRVGLAGHIANMEEIRMEYKILVGKPDGKRSVGYRWEDNIRIGTCEVACVGVGWIYLADGAQLRAVVSGCVCTANPTVGF